VFRRLVAAVSGIFARVRRFGPGVFTVARSVLFGRGGAPRPRAGRGDLVEIELDESVAALDQIGHIVILMLENRSFDHMLGYLSLEGGRTDVEGLRDGMANEHDGRSYPVHHLRATAFVKEQDPCHSGACVDEQLRGGNGGFVSSYVSTRSDPRFARDPVVMGYYGAEELPVYDFLARRFCICDRWLSAVRGATWPNRLYAVGGRAAGSRDNARPPTYDVPAFVRNLDAAGVSWRWFTPDPFPSLWAIDRSYLRFTFDNVRPFSAPFSLHDFFSSARSGNLPSVTWIDPKFVDLAGPVGSNDDHPPSDVRAGQELVLRVFNALSRSPAWKQTLLLVVYDEHGGFFDHVEPPEAPDDDPAFRAYGLRVPALVVSPRLGTRVAHDTFDHTSIIKTCLVRFCRRDDRFIPDLGRRVSEARHLGGLLQVGAAAPRPDVETIEELSAALGPWRQEALDAALSVQAEPIPPERESLTDFQEEYLDARERVLSSLTPKERARLAESFASPR
jgi:phospholipase C